ncbi:hypothetical protein E2562_035923 [Oryza meyeriana var. granulata]|uniref:DUF834 domain-containing protein n=1 Tax=Oryza meyeriana var. granulata TaxID=110450 RepID=A0A6G1CXH1_9ORYZ|nr:hypothetical protein E2562_035923 [Oryza meyeriana var. granulata]
MKRRVELDARLRMAAAVEEEADGVLEHKATREERERGEKCRCGALGGRRMELEVKAAPGGLDTGKESEIGSSCPRARRGNEMRDDATPWLGMEAAVVVRK